MEQELIQKYIETFSEKEKKSLRNSERTFRYVISNREIKRIFKMEKETRRK